MKNLIFILILTLSSFSLAEGESPLNYNENLWGHWQYIGHFYEGQFQEPLNPNLILTFEFSEDGTDRLQWHRLNEDGFCDRQGKYSFDGKVLTDQVIWVNPENGFECGKDPDMQVGHVTQTNVKIINDQIHMELPLGDKSLIYVWNRIK